MESLVCSICGGLEFRESPVLWPELVTEWQLSVNQVAYIDRQQGCACTNCGANLRVIALGNAIRDYARTSLSLRNSIKHGVFSEWRILDCNGAEGISTELSVLPNYRRVDYPEYDMRSLPFIDGSFDLVIHSDTLEHVEHPQAALEECRRLLSPNGRLCFTVPIIVERLSRSRSGLASSYHGDASAQRDDFLVHTEYGADAWTSVLRSGFSNVSITQVEYPSGIALSAWNTSAADSPSPQSNVTQADALSGSDAGAGNAETYEGSHKIYDQDGLRSIHNHEFMVEPRFAEAYARGVQAAGVDYNWHWRVHTGLWAAEAAAKLPGDFVEFGVNRGFLSSAIMRLLDWNTTGRAFYLLDTFSGIDRRYINDDDIAVGVLERNERDIASGFYTFDLDAVRANFAEWPKARIIAGAIPETLSQIDSELFAFVHIDLNCAPPEVAAAEFVWPRLVGGGIVLLDDYAYSGYRSQKLAMDAFARSEGVSILSLPTGQGLLVKPS